MAEKLYSLSLPGVTIIQETDSHGDDTGKCAAEITGDLFTSRVWICGDQDTRNAILALIALACRTGDKIPLDDAWGAGLIGVEITGDLEDLLPFLDPANG